ncbi:50S ribosomal protein L3 [Patescibacteria group bacterium]|nr:50S ribosomal protein L3 [Patescibacteria group bacterium]
MKFILGKKIGMSQMFNESGKIIPLTLVEAGPCPVVQVKTDEKDDYQATQIGFGSIKDKNVKKPQLSHFKKAGLTKAYRYLREFKGEDLKVGDILTVSIFAKGDAVKISGISKGKGFQGVVKRHGFKGGPASHGTKHNLRAPGSIGTSFPERVWRGKKMAGRMGSDRITLAGKLKIVQVDPDNNLLAVKGSLPGRKGSLLEIISAGKIDLSKKEE